MIEKLTKNAGVLLDLAMKQGADEAQVIATHGTTARVAYEKNDFQLSSANTKANFALKVHVNQRRGTVGTNETGAAALAAAADRALTLARFSLEDEYLTLPDAQAPAELPGRFDEALVELSAKDLHRMAAEFVEASRIDPRISLDGGELSVSTAHEVIVNSRGLCATDQATRIDWSLMGMGKTDEEVTSFDYLGGGSWRRQGAESKSQDMARLLSKKLLACFGARQGQSYQGTVLLSPEALGSLLFQVIWFHISGRQIMDGKSRWDKSLGELVASESFTLLDDPFNLELSGATPFDAEGVPVKRRPIIQKGLLETHADTCYTAKRRGTVSTGHAGGLHGICVAPGERTKDELIRAADKLVVVERFSGNVDPVTGDFSGVAKGSHYYVGGEYKHPLTETMIAGNAFELLKNIVDLSDEALPCYSSYLAPWVLADGVSVTAG